MCRGLTETFSVVVWIVRSCYRNCDGRLSHTRGPAAVKLLSPYVLWMRRTTHVLSATRCTVETNEPVEKDGVDVVVRDWWILGAGCHAQRPQKDGDERWQLFDVVFLTLDQTEHDTVALSHRLGVLRPDVQVHDLLPTTSTHPATEETLNLPTQPPTSPHTHCRFTRIRQQT